MTGRCVVNIEFDELDKSLSINELCEHIEKTVKESLNAEYVEVIDIDTYYEPDDEEYY